MLNMERLKNKLSFSIIIPLTIALTGCLNSNNNSANQNLVLKGSVAELKETVVLDPAFIHRQELAERSFFGFSGAQHNHLNNDHIVMNEDEIDEYISEDTKVSLDSKVGKFGGLEILWPVNGKLSSLFGMRTLGFRSKKTRKSNSSKLVSKTRMHSGIDISAPVGTPIHSSYDGVVLFSGNKNGYGESVIIGHNAEHETLYAHMSKIVVNDGQFVRSGQLIGFVGKSGRVTGANLHYETRISGVAYNPLAYLPASGNNKMKVGMPTPSLASQIAFYQNLSKVAFVSDKSKSVSN